MNIVITNSQKAESFLLIFQHIKLFTECINIQFEKNRLFVQAMDQSHISILELNIPATWFDVYEHKNASTVNISLNSSIFFRILSTRDKTQNTNIIFDLAKSDLLVVNFSGENKTEFDKHFEIPLIDNTYDLMEIPIIEYDAEFSIPSVNFANIISQLKKFGDDLDIQCSEDKIALCSSSIESGKMSAEIGIDDLTSFTITEDKIVNLSFSLLHLHNICQFYKLAKEMDIHISNDYPLKLVYKMYGDENAMMTFYLAPKIKDD